jgi:hypothetical protein
MWKPSDLKDAYHGNKKDIPCTLNLQFFIRGEHLYCIATMRSNDAWMGMPYDIYCFTSLQCLLAEHLGLKVGFYQHNVGSMHLYEKHYQKALEASKMTIGEETIWPSFHQHTDRSHQNSFLRHVERARQAEITLRCNHIERARTDDFKDETAEIVGSRLFWNLALCQLNFSPSADVKQILGSKMYPRALEWAVKMEAKRANK